MRVTFYLTKDKLWIARALQTRRDTEAILGGSSSISKEAIKALEEALRVEYEAVHGRLPGSNPKEIWKETKDNYYRHKKKKISFIVPDAYAETAHVIAQRVEEKRKSGCSITLGEEIFCLIEDKMFPERRQIWLDNANKLGYNLTAVDEDNMTKLSTFSSLGVTFVNNKIKEKNTLDEIALEIDRLEPILQEANGFTQTKFWVKAAKERLNHERKKKEEQVRSGD